MTSARALLCQHSKLNKQHPFTWLCLAGNFVSLWSLGAAKAGTKVSALPSGSRLPLDDDAHCIAQLVNQSQPIVLKVALSEHEGWQACFGVGRRFVRSEI